MKIRSIVARWVEVPMPDAGRMVSDYGPSATCGTVLVRIEREDGAVGWGETRTAGGALSLNHAVVALIERELAPRLVGEDAADITRIWELLYNGARSERALAAARTLPVLARRAPLVSAIGAIDMALWDLLGQSLGVPVYRLLGGRSKPSLPLYASGGWAGVEGIGAELTGYVERLGVSAVKMRIGSKFGTPAVSVRRVEAARRALGPDVALMVDAHGTLSLPEAKRFARDTDGLDLRWFEEPLSPDNRSGLGELRGHCATAIASGENDVSRFDCLDYVRDGLLDVLQPDLGVAGGITEGLRIAALAGAFQIEVAPHVWAGPLLFAASAHLAIASPQIAILEYPAAANPLMAALAREPWPVRDGALAIPDRPGLGVLIDEDAIETYAVRH